MRASPAERAGAQPAGAPRVPRLGVLATHPIQYQAPLYRELARRGRVDLDVAFLSDKGIRVYRDAGFGCDVAWDVDLLGGYRHRFLGGTRARPLRGLNSWLSEQDVLVVHGHRQPVMLTAAALATLRRRPYLLRGEAHPAGLGLGSGRWGRVLRDAVAGRLVRGSAGGLAIGSLNAEFYRRFGAVRQFFAPYSVDNERFRATSGPFRADRASRLQALGLPPDRPVAVFAGKLSPVKRPLDAIAATAALRGRMSLLIVGDGPLREAAEHEARGLPVACTGFINQADMPRYYALGDVFVLPSGVEPWGLTVNEAMACGLLPVVSDQVGSGPDLVAGLGEVYPVGDVAALAAALGRAAGTVRDPGTAGEITRRVDAYSLGATAAGFEEATMAAVGGDRSATGDRVA
ncbi:MAG: hypothetical protein QOI35_2475 [Cryptosporangiaceae bacterium]|nr:hypothetical protein [Cryptosporangiaceae bacterium]